MLDFGFYNMDCLEGMKQFPDNYFELAIVDPPYGDAGGGFSGKERFGERFERYRLPYRGNVGGEVRKKIAAWDVAPGKKYFEELFRVSRNQIIWGGELLRSTSDAVFSDLAQTNNFRKLYNGYGRIRLDVIQ